MKIITHFLWVQLKTILNRVFMANGMCWNWSFFSWPILTVYESKIRFRSQFLFDNMVFNYQYQGAALLKITFYFHKTCTLGQNRCTKSYLKTVSNKPPLWPKIPLLFFLILVLNQNWAVGPILVHNFKIEIQCAKTLPLKTYFDIKTMKSVQGRSGSSQFVKKGLFLSNTA